MLETLIFILKFSFSTFESWWRRWFGGGFIGGNECENKWYNARVFQHIVGGLVMFLSILFLKDFDKLSFCNWIVPESFEKYLPYILALYVTAIVHGFYWARAHGPGFDISRDKNPTEKTIQRYKKEWWNKICEWLVPTDDWYGYGYDVLWMKLRYTVFTLLLMPVYGFDIIFMGLLVAPIYSICWALSENKPELFKKFPKKMQIDGPTSFAEWIVGFTTGLCLMFL